MTLLVWAANNALWLALVAALIALALRFERKLSKRFHKWLLFTSIFIGLLLPILGFFKKHLDDQWKAELQHRIAPEKWSNAVVKDGVLLLDWSKSTAWATNPTDTTYRIAFTNTPAAPCNMLLLISTPVTFVPQISWSPSIVWTSQVDVTSNRTYLLSIMWDGSAYAFAPIYSR